MNFLNNKLLFNDIRRAVITAVIVGPTLTFINQGSEIMAGSALRIWPTILTFMVPFLVSFVSAVLSRKQKEPAP